MEMLFVAVGGFLDGGLKKAGGGNPYVRVPLA